MARLRNWRLVAAGIALIAALMVAIEIRPDGLFPYSHAYGGFAIASDRPIDPAIDRVIDDARRRLSSSFMTRPDDRFRVFICNRPWRLRLFTGNTALGGGTAYGTRNIFLRAADIRSNTLRPAGRVLLDQGHRPMSYFIAHEATHVLLLRRYGLATMLRSPAWLVEGYADHVAKAGDFDIAENRTLLRQNNPLLSDAAARRGLYRRYQLMVDTALGAKGVTVDALFADPPPADRLIDPARARAPTPD